MNGHRRAKISPPAALVGGAAAIWAGRGGWLDQIQRPPSHIREDQEL
jgi:hypothetical protein